MAQDFGILITGPGSDAVTTDSDASQVVMNTAHPFIKIDTQNDNGFLTLILSIVHDPPEPSGGNTDAYTTLYQFAHGYKYIPTPEVLFNVTNPPPILFGGQIYALESIFLGGQSVFDGVYLYAVADATNVYIICDKQNFGGGFANIITGTNVTITTHVFVDDLGI